MYFTSTPSDSDLQHHGIKGQKWGIRRYQNYDGTRIDSTSKKTKTGSSSPEELQSYMRSNVRYSEFTKLKSSDEVLKSGSGSCHDQVMLELDELEKMGLKPTATFLIEYDPKSGQGGTTHSFVTYQKNDKTVWFENAWGGREGLHEYSDLDSIKTDILRRHKSGEFGDVSKFSKIEFSDFGSHKPGETLQELVNIALQTKDEIKHGERGGCTLQFSIIKSDSDLEHHGILGQKWGVRRYQNRDGSLTDLGKRRIKTSDSDTPDDISDKIHAEVAKDYGRISSAQNSAANAARSASNIANRSANAERAKAKSDMDVSEMSDEELRARINRMNLERQYKDLSTETVGTGKRVLSDILQTTGDVLAIGASAAGILLAIHQLKSGSGK